MAKFPRIGIRIRDGQVIPKWYGLAWVEWESNEAVCMPLGLNLLAALTRSALATIRHAGTAVRRNPRDAYAQGLRARLHPHCSLTLTRSIAPDHVWHWSVTMPDGHVYDVSHGPMTFEQALADMQKRGVVALDAADTIWRASRPEASHG